MIIRWIVLLITILSLPGCSNIFGDDTTISSDFTAGLNPVAIKIVTAAGDAGTEITTSTLTDNAAITLYAISVNSKGAYMEDVSVSWLNTNSLGSFSSATGSSTTFTPNAAAGSETIIANHATLGSDTTGLTVNFTVSLITGLQAWYKADYGVTFDGSNLVTTWTDQSANVNSATQGGANSIKPLYVASAINGMPALRLDGVDDFLTTGASIVNGNSARTIFIVSTNIANTGTYNAFLDLTNVSAGTGTNYGITAEVAVRVSGNRIFNESIAAGETKVLTVTNAAAATSAGINTYLDGVLSTESASSVQALNTLTNPALIGRAAFTASFCNCDIAEIIVYNTELSVADRQNVEAYLKTKYGL